MVKAGGNGQLGKVDDFLVKWLGGIMLIPSRAKPISELGYSNSMLVKKLPRRNSDLGDWGFLGRLELETAKGRTIGISLPSFSFSDGIPACCLGGVPDASGVKVAPMEFIFLMSDNTEGF
jgi:hypothetical protein